MNNQDFTAELENSQTLASEFHSPTMPCRQDDIPYSEPEICNETVYSDDGIIVKRLWKWNVVALHEDRESGLIQVLLSGFAFNYEGISTYASAEGKRLCRINFDYMDHFHEGLAIVAVAGYGYGYINTDMDIVIPMKYDDADIFINGKAMVKRDDKCFYIDNKGLETAISLAITAEKYQELGCFSEDMCKVSTLQLDSENFAYFDDNAHLAGLWGFVNKCGEEVIPPQYIFANDFSNGIAIVCKGEWIISKNWDADRCDTEKYYSEEQLWGAIDKNGNEAFPFIFDDIGFFSDTTDLFIAHYGGWESGKYGVIDGTGKWLAEPIFEKIGYDYHDGMFTFYDSADFDDDSLMGIYDINLNKVLFEPQFLNIDFRQDEWIEVEVFDVELGRSIEKLIDKNGNEKFHSIYTSIFTVSYPYEVSIRDDDGTRDGLIDKNGNVVLPCKYTTAWNGISAEKKLIIFISNDRQGLMDFDDNVLVEPKYFEIYGLENPLLTVRVGEKGNYKEGLISTGGKVVLPAIYKRISWCSNNRIICCADGYCEFMQII